MGPDSGDAKLSEPSVIRAGDIDPGYDWSRAIPAPGFGLLGQHVHAERINGDEAGVRQQGDPDRAKVGGPSRIRYRSVTSDTSNGSRLPRRLRCGGHRPSLSW